MEYMCTVNEVTQEKNEWKGVTDAKKCDVGVIIMVIYSLSLLQGKRVV